MKALLVAIFALTSTSAFAYHVQSLQLSEDKTALEITVSFTGCGPKKFDLMVGCGRSLPAQCALEIVGPEQGLFTCQAEIQQTLSFKLANYGLDTYSASEATLSIEGGRDGVLKLKLPKFN